MCASAEKRRPFYRPAVEEMVVVLQITNLQEQHTKLSFTALQTKIDIHYTTTSQNIKLRNENPNTAPY